MKVEDKLVVLKDGRNAIIRSAQVTDAKQINEVFAKTKSQTRFIALSPDDKDSTISEQEERINRYLNSEDEVLLVAVVDGEIAGSCSFGSRRRTARTRHRASVGIALEESYTNVGLGTEMLKYAINICIDMRFERLELGYIEQNERAVKVYKRLGFEETGRIKDCLKYNDGTYADEILMSMSLIN